MEGVGPVFPAIFIGIAIATLYVIVFDVSPTAWLTGSALDRQPVEAEAAHVAGTSAPPSSATRAPNRSSAG